jgi:N-acetylglucosaminyldiphosphoundecaprenol N-acetyl-beta-D-mannosaminyltransferase
MTLSAAASRAPARHEVLGTQVYGIDLDGALAWIRDRIASRLPGYVVTLNGAMLVRAAREPAVRDLVNGAALVTADGIGVVLAARIVGVALPGRVAGIDLVSALLAEAGSAGYRIFLLGGAPGVGEAAARALRGRHPALQIVGTYHGYFPPDEEAQLGETIRQAHPDVLLVALGAPRQEQWMARWSARLGIPVSIGVGGTLDVLAGRVSRAPRWMRTVGLEWLYRLLREPRRWSVVRTIPPLFLLALGERLRRR